MCRARLTLGVERRHGRAVGCVVALPEALDVAGIARDLARAGVADVGLNARTRRTHVPARAAVLHKGMRVRSEKWGDTPGESSDHTRSRYGDGRRSEGTRIQLPSDEWTRGGRVSEREPHSAAGNRVKRTELSVATSTLQSAVESMPHVAQPASHTQLPFASHVPWPEHGGEVAQAGLGALWKKHHGTLHRAHATVHAHSSSVSVGDSGQAAAAIASAQHQRGEKTAVATRTSGAQSLHYGHSLVGVGRGAGHPAAALGNALLLVDAAVAAVRAVARVTPTEVAQHGRVAREAASTHRHTATPCRRHSQRTARVPLPRPSCDSKCTLRRQERTRQGQARARAWLQKERWWPFLRGLRFALLAPGMERCRTPELLVAGMGRVMLIVACVSCGAQILVRGDGGGGEHVARRLAETNWSRG
jgi:hypothetical protein